MPVKFQKYTLAYSQYPCSQVRKAKHWLTIDCTWKQQLGTPVMYFLEFLISWSRRTHSKFRQSFLLADQIKGNFFLKTYSHSHWHSTNSVADSFFLSHHNYVLWDSNINWTPQGTFQESSGAFFTWLGLLTHPGLWDEQLLDSQPLQCYWWSIKTTLCKAIYIYYNVY